MSKLLDGKTLAGQVREEIKREIAESDIKPCLALINASDDAASATYVKHKRRACDEVDIQSLLFQPFGQNACELPNLPDPEAKLLEVVEDCNRQDFIHGILVQLPLPACVNTSKVFDLIRPEKDVDVFNPKNVGLLLQDRAKFLTCTPHGIHLLLKRNGIDVKGKDVVVVNSSNIVGKPLFALLLHAGATVTVCHIDTPPDMLARKCRQANIVVVAVGIPHFLKPDMVSPGSVVVDVGITRVDGKIVGDVDPGVREVAEWVSPVPGGVGPMTVTMLLKNTLEAAKSLVYTTN